MTTQHTPGPWSLGKARMGFHNHAMMPVITVSGRYVAEISPNGRTTRKAGNNRVMQLKVFSAEDDANARLIASAPDHALIGWAMCVQDGTWEEWSTGAGEFCFCGLRYATRLDEFGCPILTDALRAALSLARGSV